MHVKPAYLHLPMIVVGVVLNGFSIAPARADSLSAAVLVSVASLIAAARLGAPLRRR